MKTPRIVISVVVGLALSSSVQAQIATIDIKAITEMGQQLTQLKSQLEQQKNMLRNMTEGLTGLGDEFFNDLNNSMPDSWEDVISPNGRYGQSGRDIFEDRERELEDMSPRDASRRIHARQNEQRAAQLAMLQDVYQNNERQMREMQLLSSRIETATTQRQVQDLQARILASQGAVEANNMRLNNMTMLRNAEADLLEQESYDAFHRRSTGGGEPSQLRLVR